MKHAGGSDYPSGDIPETPRSDPVTARDKKAILKRIRKECKRDKIDVASTNQIKRDNPSKSKMFGNQQETTIPQNNNNIYSEQIPERR